MAGSVTPSVDKSAQCPVLSAVSTLLRDPTPDSPARAGIPLAGPEGGSSRGSLYKTPTELQAAAAAAAATLRLSRALLCTARRVAYCITVGAL